MAPAGRYPSTLDCCGSARAATALLELHARPPLDACTYLGTTCAATALDLHVDILGCLGSAGVENAYLALPAAEPARGVGAALLCRAAAARALRCLPRLTVSTSTSGVSAARPLAASAATPHLW